jgi:hypothetical protein
MVFVATDADQFAVLDLEYHRAGIGTIMRAAAEEFLGTGFEFG